MGGGDRPTAHSSMVYDAAIPTHIGDLYFKAVIPDLTYEAALTQALVPWFSNGILQILAIQ